MRIILVPILPQIQSEIKKYGSDQIVRIDLNEEEFDRFYSEAKKGDSGIPLIDLEHVRYDKPRKGSHARVDGVSVQCCY